MELIMFYLPCGSNEEASAIIRSLLDQKLIACGNIMPSYSIYMWHDALSEDKECIAIIKTLPELLEKVQQKILILHSYDTPAILYWTAKCNQQYYDWLKQTCKVP
ncbi:MAG: divalent-cation tolerance protein CutA [Saprospiraceae bacterium]|jgi:periplasmic divalent cation tolerance protein|nr:divalent-cation tolerance protein CutA [Saprospiraceae bacterium]MBP6447311.1 divalent-cation tolerance protein CutA [Saprospiraceae bacterium]